MVAQQVLAAPRGLTITSAAGEAGQSELRLRWEAVPGASGYEVLQWRRGKWWLDDQDPNRTPLTTSTSISGLDSNSAYEFCVRAVGEGGKTSAYSASAGGRTMAPGASGSAGNTPGFSMRAAKGVALDPPSGVIAFFSEQDRIRISWRPVEGAMRYSIEEEKDGVWAPARKVVGAPSATQVTVPDHPHPGPYKFRVRAVNREGTLSEPSWAITVEH